MLLKADLGELCDGIGGRPTGSLACARAIGWAVKKFRDIGIQNVSVEQFTARSLWLPVSAEALPSRRSDSIFGSWPAPMSPSTSAPIEARLVDAGDGTPEAFAKLGVALKGSIVLIHSSEMKTLDDLFGEYMRNAALLEAARKYQPAALLLESTRPRLLALPASRFRSDSNYAPVPTALVSPRARRTAGAAGAERRSPGAPGDVQQNRADFPYESSNVIAEIRGREKPDEIVHDRRAPGLLGSRHRRRGQRRERRHGDRSGARLP